MQKKSNSQASASVYLRDIDPAVKRAFKAACARRGRTMTDQVRQYMIDLIREDEPKEIRKIRNSERKTA